MQAAVPLQEASKRARGLKEVSKADRVMEWMWRKRTRAILLHLHLQLGVLVKASKQIPRRVGNEQLRLQMQKRGLQGLEALLEAEYFATDTLARCCVQPSLPKRP